MVKVIIPIQSISDVITNSSSELFCTIYSKEHLDDIYEFFKEILDSKYSDDSISVYMEHKSNYPDEEYYKDYPDNWIEIHMPYDYYNSSKVFKLGIEAIMEKNFNGNYKIVFEDENY